MNSPPVSGPHDVPNLRLYLLDRWRAGGVFEQATRVSREVLTLNDPITAKYGWRAREESEWQRMHLGNPDLILWWVSEEMVGEVSHVAGELPDDVRPVDVPGIVVGEDLLPGLVVLEKPMVGLDAQSDRQILVDGLIYGGTQLPPLHGKPWRKAVSIGAYRHFRPGDEGQFGARCDEWLPLGRSDWPVLEPLHQKIDESANDQQHRSMMEDRKWLAALYLVAADQRVAAVKRVEPTRKELRRPSERRKLSPAVRVVYLRQLDVERERAAATAAGRKPPRAHIVRSHARWQAHGPGRQERKLILVPRHARGHGGEPEEGPPTVKAIV